MRLKNKKTGEIIERYIIETASAIGAGLILQDNDTNKHYQYNSLAELNAEWEDYEEPKKHYEILAMGAVMECKDADDEIFRNQGQREIGNYFETEKEAQLAVEKLKAFKRLKDKGFKFTGFEETDRGCLGDFTIYCYTKPDYTRPYDDVKDDLDLLFGGEE